MQRHQKDHGLRSYVTRRFWGGTFPTRAGADQELVRNSSVCSWYFREEGCTQCASYPREDYRLVSFFSEEVEFFPAAAVEVWIALFESEYLPPLSKIVQPHLEEFFLGLVCVSGELARDTNFRPTGNEVQNWRGHEFIC